MNTENIHRYIEIGKRDIDWYKECEKIFIELFGKRKLKLVTKIFAATSINTSLKSNIRLFRKALYEIENDLPIGNYLPNIRMQLEKIRKGKQLSGRKIRSFQQAMSGNPNAVVVDTWVLRAFEMDVVYFRQKKGTKPGIGLYRSAGTTDKKYSQIENHITKLAKDMELEPRQVCAMIWAGIRIERSGDRQTHYKEILKYKLQNLFNCI